MVALIQHLGQHHEPFHLALTANIAAQARIDLLLSEDYFEDLRFFLVTKLYIAPQEPDG